MGLIKKLAGKTAIGGLASEIMDSDKDKKKSPLKYSQRDMDRAKRKKKQASAPTRRTQTALDGEPLG